MKLNAILVTSNEVLSDVDSNSEENEVVSAELESSSEAPTEEASSGPSESDDLDMVPMGLASLSPPIVRVMLSAYWKHIKKALDWT